MNYDSQDGASSLGLHTRRRSQDHYFTPGDVQQGYISLLVVVKLKEEAAVANWNVVWMRSSACFDLSKETPRSCLSHFSPFNWTHFSFSFRSSLDSGQSGWIKSCLITTKSIVTDARDSCKACQWQDQFKIALVNYEQLVAAGFLFGSTFQGVLYNLDELCIDDPTVHWLNLKSCNPEVSHCCSYY